VGIADECDGAVPGHEVAQALVGTRLHVDRRRRQHDVVHVISRGIRDLGVDGRPLVVERPKGRDVAGERAIASADPPPRLADVDRDQHRSCVEPKVGANHLGGDRAPAEGDHQRRPRRQGPNGIGLFEKPEVAAVEELGDRNALRFLDRLVEIDEVALQRFRHLSAQCRLAGAHEADQRDVLV
jgi:hypothetical protein